MDQLASRGTTFTNAHCQAPLCNASRTSLMIGLRPDTTGIYGLAPWFRDVESLRQVVSLPNTSTLTDTRPTAPGRFTTALMVALKPTRISRSSAPGEGGSLAQDEAG